MKDANEKTQTPDTKRTVVFLISDTHPDRNKILRELQKTHRVFTAPKLNQAISILSQIDKEAMLLMTRSVESGDDYRYFAPRLAQKSTAVAIISVDEPLDIKDPLIFWIKSYQLSDILAGVELAANCTQVQTS